MLDIGWAEMMVVAVVAIIVIGPKDLPKALSTVGKLVGKARAMAREFQSGLEDIAREAELDEIKKTVDKAGAFNPKKQIENMIDPSGTADKLFETPASTSPATQEKDAESVAKPTEPRKEGTAGIAAPSSPAETKETAAAEPTPVASDPEKKTASGV
ncbi:Sec-independent protein translocase protein TatB [Oceanibacterium hippocampi]|uniref:Sec-independent protein translocase protein TatB n=1 Tax=Oceanibacterium hippocampi TaxID=745714 RepID=A0A1Y5U4R8_9PROT|nr:Sec-independent protein translocase protein TatB [Oceanibacterium hippocampi]SLN77223.1 Sec-independent protein translocase protein TatB [Oceanibacterium hippocampi]